MVRPLVDMYGHTCHNGSPTSILQSRLCCALQCYKSHCFFLNIDFLIVFSRADRDDVYSKEHQRIPRPPDSPRSQPKSSRSQRRVTSSEENKSTEQIPMQDK